MGAKYGTDFVDKLGGMRASGLKHQSLIIPQSIKTKQSPWNVTTKTSNTYVDPAVETGIPAARGDIPIPLLIGKRLITNFNTIWTGVPVTRVEVTRTEPTYVIARGRYYGWNGNPGWTTFLKGDALDAYYEKNPDAVQTITTVKTTVDFAIGLCLGPGTRLHKIENESGNIVWQNSVGTVPTAEPDIISIPAFCERMYFYSGADNQSVNPVMSAKEGAARTPAYRGTSYMVVQGAYITTDMEPIDGMGFELSRTVNKLGLAPEYVQNEYYDQNIANAIVEIITDGWNGAKMPIDYIDIPSFTAGAIKLANEGNWCSVLVSTQAVAASVVVGLLQQADACLRWNARTTKYELKLHREDFDVGTLPAFSEDNLADVPNLTKTQWRNLPKIVNVSYVDRANRYTETTIGLKVNSHVDEYAALSANITLGAVTSTDVASKVLPMVAARGITPLLSGTIEAGREAEPLLPGDVIAVTWPYITGLIDFPMRVIDKREAGAMKDTYVLTVEQAILPAKNMQRPAPQRLAGVTNQTVDEPDANDISVMALPLMFLKQNGGTFAPGITETSAAYAVPAFMIESTSAPSYAVEGWGSPDLDNVHFTTMTNAPIVGTLSTAIDALDGYDTGIVDITITVDRWSSSLETVSRNAGGWVLIGDEIFQFDTSVGPVPSITLVNARRGLIDTVAKSHLLGAKVYVLPDFSMIGKYAIPTDNLYLTVFGTAGFRVSETSAFKPVTGIDLVRAVRPACPQNGQITEDGTPVWPREDSPEITIGNDYVVSWEQRDRRAKRTNYRNEGSMIPQDPTLYTVTLTSPGNVVNVLASNVAGDDTAVSIPSGLTAGAATITIEASAAHGVSINKETIHLTLI